MAAHRAGRAVAPFVNGTVATHLITPEVLASVCIAGMGANAVVPRIGGGHATTRSTRAPLSQSKLTGDAAPARMSAVERPRSSASLAYRLTVLGSAAWGRPWAP